MAQEDATRVEERDGAVAETIPPASEPSLGAKSLSALSDSADVSVADLASSAFGQGSDTIKSAAIGGKSGADLLSEAASNGVHLPSGSAAHYDPLTGSYQKPSTGESFAIQPEAQETKQEAPEDKGGEWEVVTRRDSAHPPAQPADSVADTNAHPPAQPADPLTEANAGPETAIPVPHAKPVEVDQPLQVDSLPLKEAPTELDVRPLEPEQASPEVVKAAAEFKGKPETEPTVEEQPPPPGLKSEVDVKSAEPPAADLAVHAETVKPEPVLAASTTETSGISVEPEESVAPVETTEEVLAGAEESVAPVEPIDELPAAAAAVPVVAALEESYEPAVAGLDEQAVESALEAPEHADVPAAFIDGAEKGLASFTGKEDVLLASGKFEDSGVKADDGIVSDGPILKESENVTQVDEEQTEASKDEEWYKLPLPLAVVGGAAAVAFSLILGVVLFRRSKKRTEERD
eukprot:TRINITY_DN92_c0_g1_i1.p1 TRINITY_DN92_c0_g1~~TRINITY_DN92_c0_g1_i1.p1  ORF type:complete len:462 (+),score=132.30 TRINITY_DN92_c0_g1_i1:68-1453(+)